MPLTYLAERRVNGVFFGLGSEDLSGHGYGLLVDLYRRLDLAHGLARYRACDTTWRMDTSLAANRVRLALREAGYQEWEGGRRGFIVEGDPQGGWVAVNYFPGLPTARRKRERELTKYRDLLLTAGFTVTPSPYTSGVLRVTLPGG
jgi:hypothetical protein